MTTPTEGLGFTSQSPQRIERVSITVLEVSQTSTLSPTLQTKLQEQRQYIVAEFKQSHQFLKKREQHLLDQLATLEQLLTEGREKFKTRGVSELDRLTLVISELEGKARQPAAELMQVRVILAQVGDRYHCYMAFEEILPPRLSV